MHKVCLREIARDFIGSANFRDEWEFRYILVYSSIIAGLFLDGHNWNTSNVRYIECFLSGVQDSRKQSPLDDFKEKRSYKHGSGNAFPHNYGPLKLRKNKIL